MTTYIKFFNEDETHYDLKYKTGLNIDPIPFNTENSCSSGGIYFVSEENSLRWMLNWHDEYTYVREVKLHKDSKLHMEVGTIEKYKANKVILGKRRKLYDLDTFKWLMNKGAYYDKEILYDFVEKTRKTGNIELAEYIAKTYKKELEDKYQSCINTIVSSTIKFRTLEELKSCFKKYKSAYVDSFDVLLCIKTGKLDILKYILKSSRASKSIKDDETYLFRILQSLESTKESFNCFKFYISQRTTPIIINMSRGMESIKTPEILDYLKPFIKFSKIHVNDHLFPSYPTCSVEFIEFLISNKKYKAIELLNLIINTRGIDKNIAIKLYNMAAQITTSENLIEKKSAAALSIIQLQGITTEDLKCILKDVSELEIGHYRGFDMISFMANTNIDTMYKFEIVKKIKNLDNFMISKNNFVFKMIHAYNRNHSHYNEQDITISDLKLIINNLHIFFNDDNIDKDDIVNYDLILSRLIASGQDAPFEKFHPLLKLIKTKNQDISKFYGSYISALYNAEHDIVKFLLKNGLDPSNKACTTFDMSKYSKSLYTNI